MNDYILEAYADKLLEDEVRAKVKRKHSREQRRQHHLAGHNAAPNLGALCAPGTPLRMIAHDPSWSLNQVG